jgi:hypothetical protein
MAYYGSRAESRQRILSKKTEVFLWFLLEPKPLGLENWFLPIPGTYKYQEQVLSCISLLLVQVLDEQLYCVFVSFRMCSYLTKRVSRWTH